MHEVKCPFCGREMRPGVLWGDSRICWSPEGEPIPQFRLRAVVPEGHVALAGPFGHLKGHTVTAYYCAACKKVIADTE